MLRAHRAGQAEYRLSLGVVFEDHGLVFPGPTGRPLDPSVFTRNFKKLARSEGFPELRLTNFDMPTRPGSSRRESILG